MALCPGPGGAMWVGTGQARQGRSHKEACVSRGIKACGVCFCLK